jgi:hypothetical protein
MTRSTWLKAQALLAEAALNGGILRGPVSAEYAEALSRLLQSGKLEVADDQTGEPAYKIKLGALSTER